MEPILQVHNGPEVVPGLFYGSLWMHKALGEVSVCMHCAAHKVSVLGVCEVAVRLQLGCTVCL